MIVKYSIFESIKTLLAWFGDSKVTHNGKPLLVYHGTNTKFLKFDKKYINTIEPKGDYIGCGFYFTGDYYTALKYADSSVKKKGGEPNVIKAYLKIENPILINSAEDAKNLRDIFGGEIEYYKLSKSNPYKIRETLIELGYDGLIDNTYNQYAVFIESQILIEE